MNRELSIHDHVLNRQGNQLSVWVEYDTRVQRINITLFGYEYWLDKGGHLDWVQDSPDEGGNHRQGSGKYSIEEYWSLGDKLIHKDILRYIETHALYDGQLKITDDTVTYLKERLERKRLSVA